MLKHKRAISTFMHIILIVISAIIGGIISYMLTIAYYVEVGFNVPENTTAITITDVYINPEDATSFRITILNPSFSVSDATVTKIAVSVANDTVLYEVVETDPPIGDGLVVPKGEAINITCSALEVNEKRIRWGEFAYMFADQPIIIHVFSEDSSSTNKMERLPYVKLEVTPKFGENFSNFTIELKNDEDSETALTINSVELSRVKGSRFTYFLYLDRIPIETTAPELPITLERNESKVLTCKLNWYGINETSISISTEQGYKIYVENLTLPQIYFEIKNVTFDPDYTDQFNITMINYQDSSGTTIIKRIEIATEEGNITSFNITMPLLPGMEWNYLCTWNWKNYRGKELNVTVFLKEGINQSFQVTTPPPIILELVNKTSIFSLKDRKHMNVTVLNHPSSLGTVNITMIQVEEVTINVAELVDPGENVTIHCSLGKNWTDYEKESLKLVVVYENEYSGNETFVIPLPEKAELKVISVKCLRYGVINHLNITVENMPYSLSDLTISQFIVGFQNKSTTSNVSIVITPGERISIIVTVQLGIEPGKEVTIKVITKEGVEAQWIGVPSTP